MPKDINSQVILGIDPGSRRTGYGVIRFSAGKAEYIACGCLQVYDEDFSKRIQKIFHGVSKVVVEHQPTAVAVEEVFLRDNFKVALKLGQARGAAIAAVMAQGDIAFSEYSPREVKKATVGYGAAKKEQMQEMIRLLLNLKSTPQEDAADALAVALCHAYTEQGLNRLGAVKQSRGRLT